MACNYNQVVSSIIAEFCKMGQKVSHIIAEMPADAQCCPAQIFNVLFYVVCFPPGLGAGQCWAGPGDAVTLCPCP